MLAAVARHQPRRWVCVVVNSGTRGLSTETVSSTADGSAPPPLPSTGTKTAKTRSSRMHPRPRKTESYSPHFPELPPSFGRNQMLPVSNSTRALLESIVAQFNAPVRYAFAYGSGVFEQEGYVQQTTTGKDAPMLDFMFAVTHPSHWHSINMQQHPSHYPLHARTLGSDFVSYVQDVRPGVWFNAYVPMNGVTIKYGVTTVDNLCSDLLHWRSLYLAGRMHKPIRIIKDDARVRLTQQVNLVSAVRTALLTLPEQFSETELYERIAGLSYAGDPRMLLPAENRSKVRNIVTKQSPQFRELYHRLVVALPGVHWSGSSTVQQDITPNARAAHLRKLPLTLSDRLQRRFSAIPSLPEKSTDESAYWAHIAGSDRLEKVINEEIRGIVRSPATIQSVKGVISAGVGKSLRYSSSKISKWWKGSNST